MPPLRLPDWRAASAYEAITGEEKRKIQVEEGGFEPWTFGVPEQNRATDPQKLVLETRPQKGPVQTLGCTLCRVVEYTLHSTHTEKEGSAKRNGRPGP